MQPNKIYNLDCRDGLSRLMPASFTSVVTSPPYGTMRSYDGTAWDFSVFKDVADQLWRITANGGLICWVVSDQFKDLASTCDKHRQLLYFVDVLGFRLFHELILNVVDQRPMHRRYRSSSIHSCYVLSKGRPRYWRILKDRKNLGTGGRPDFFVREPDGSKRRMQAKRTRGEFGQRSALWTYTAGAIGDRIEHPSKMLEGIAEDLIIAFSMPGDCVLDPFSGVATTAKMAKLNFRKYLGFEICKEYWALGNERLEKAQPKV